MKTTDNRYCHNCGIEFEPHTTNQIYRSQECYRSVHPQRPIVNRNCAWCHAIFTSYKGNSLMTRQKFCSINCRYEAKRAREKIFNRYFFENEKMHQELERLAKLGKDYKLEG